MTLALDAWISECSSHDDFRERVKAERNDFQPSQLETFNDSVGLTTENELAKYDSGRDSLNSRAKAGEDGSQNCHH